MARPYFARFALTLSLLWLAAGALYKLFEGSPNDLPALVKNATELGALDTLRVTIGIELAVIGLVIALPRIGWFFLAGAFATFIAVLVPLVMEGAASCGCFGGNIEIDPRVMLAVDGGLLLFLLSTRPWRTLPKGSGLGLPALLPFLAVAVIAPYGKLKQEALPKLEPRRVGQPANVLPGAPEVLDPATAAAVRGDNPERDPAAVTPEVAVEDASPGGAPTVAPTVEPAGSKLPEFFDLRVSDWVGQDVWGTPLTNFYEAGLAAGYGQGAFLPGGHVILYRQTCEHCKAHLEKVWQEVQNGEPQWAGRSLVLLRLVEDKDTDENNVCKMLPEPSEKIAFPPLKRGYGITTPYSFDVDDSNLIQNPVDLREQK